MKKILLFFLILFFATAQMLWAQAPVACFSALGGQSFPVTQCGPFFLALNNCSTGTYDSVVWKEQISSNHNCTGPWGLTFIAAKAGALASSGNSYSLTVDGSYKVCLYVYNRTTNQVDSFCQCVAIVYPFPSPDFVANDTIGCGSLTVTYSPQIQLGSTPYGPLTWYFGDNTTTTTSGATNVSHTYSCLSTNPPCYTVSLSVTDAHGCSKVVTKPCYIQVACPPTVSLTTSGGNTCTVPSTINLQASASGLIGQGIYSFWYPPTSSPPNAPSVGPTTNATAQATFNTVGCHNVIVEVKDSLTGCTNYDSIVNAICIENIVVDSFYAYPTAVCCTQPIGIRFKAHMNPANTGCSIGGTLAVTPAGGTASTLGSINNSGWMYYSIPCGNITATTVYSVCFQSNQVNNNCNSCVVNYSACLPITIYPNPLAQIIQPNHDTVRCSVNHPFCFTATQNATNTGATFQWWKGNMSGTATTGTTFCATFPNYGRFKVYLKVCANVAHGGCCAVDSFWVSQIHQSGTFIIAPSTSTCNTNCVTILVDSSQVDAMYHRIDSAYVYIFGDGSAPMFSSHASMLHCYTSSIDTCFTVKVIHITHTMGGVFCEDTMTLQKAVAVGHKVHPTFTVSPPEQCLLHGSACFHITPNTPHLPQTNTTGICGEGCHFYFTTPTSTSPDGEVFSCDTSIVCISDLGTFNAHYTIVDHGCHDTTTLLNAVIVKGILGTINDTNICGGGNFCVKFSPSFIMYPLPTHIADSTDVTTIITAPACGAPTIYHQKVAGGIKVAPPFIHCFCAAGSYQIMLIVKNDSLGCPPDTVTKTIFVSNYVAKINLLPTGIDTALCGVYQWCFTAENSTPGRPYNYHINWNFGDSTFRNGDASTDTTLVRPCHTFAHCGIHRVRLIVSGDCADTAYQTIIIHDIFPNITATPLNANCGNCVVFNNATNYCMGAALKTIINFGNGISDTFFGNWSKDTFCYNSPITSNCNYVITDNFGCVKTGSITINSINGITPCVAGIADSAICLGSTINFSV